MELVSVIIPVYNAEKYIDKCLQSIIDQNYKNIEIIIVNDGSTDRSQLKIEEFKRRFSYIKSIQIENHGQGYARNLALKKALGKYVMFIDADDFIEAETIRLAVEKMESEDSDVVIFDWKYFHHNGGWYSYNHSNIIYREKSLSGKDTLEILGVHAYFTVNKLYRIEFLKNEIEYAEEYIYEDNPFWVQVAIKANKISLIPKPLYNVRIGTPSTTKINYDSDKHAVSYIKAVESSLKYVTESGYRNEDFYFLYKYFVKKFQIYRRSRIPKNLRKAFTKDFVHALKDISIDLPVKNKLIYYSYKLNVFSKERYVLFNLLIWLKNLRKKQRKLKKKIILEINKRKDKKSLDEIELLKEQFSKNIILFMGFDYKYTGNSRYLFEEIIREKHEEIDVYFVTNNKLVEEQYRISPESNEFKAVFTNADIVIFESWIPTKFKKQANALWIQLWHGTPLKKLLFDSNEKEIVSANPKHKNYKYNDIKRWDYLICDSPNICMYFESAFGIKPNKILPLGYPRVKYLLDNMNNENLQRLIKNNYNIPSDKQIITYMPTWRDYNYGEEKDFSYKIDIFKLKKMLGNDYFIISKDHNYLGEKTEINDMETQELLLISDCLITDYSSVMFDAFSIDLKTIIYCNDFYKYQKSRGVYDEIWEDLDPYIVNSEESLVERIKEGTKYDYEAIKDKYCYRNLYQRNLSKSLLDYFNTNTYDGFEKRILIIVDCCIDYEKVNNYIIDLRKLGFFVYIASFDKTSYFEYNKLLNDYFSIIKKEELDEIVRQYNFYEVIDYRKVY